MKDVDYKWIGLGMEQEIFRSRDWIYCFLFFDKYTCAALTFFIEGLALRYFLKKVLKVIILIMIQIHCLIQLFHFNEGADTSTQLCFNNYE